MLAVDSNVIVRYLTNDDPQQSSRARKLVEESRIWVPITVLLETEWVLCSVYRYPQAQVATALRGFAGLPSVSLENPSLAAQALDWSERGIDFADALHVGTSAQCDAFVTFDTTFVRAARKIGAPNVRQP